MKAFRRWLTGLFVLMIASGLGSGALAASEFDMELTVGAMVSLSLDGGAAEYAFTPAANGEYAAYLFPADEGDVGNPELLGCELACLDERLSHRCGIIEH